MHIYSQSCHETFLISLQSIAVNFKQTLISIFYIAKHEQHVYCKIYVHVFDRLIPISVNYTILMIELLQFLEHNSQ